MCRVHTFYKDKRHNKLDLKLYNIQIYTEVEFFFAFAIYQNMMWILGVLMALEYILLLTEIELRIQMIF